MNLDPQVQVPGGTKKNNSIPKADYLRYTVGYDRFFFFRPLNPTNSFIFVSALNGQWNVTARREKDFRFNGLAKPGKNQVESGRIPGNPACQTPPFGLLCVTAPPKNFEDEKKFEHFFNLTLQTDYLHGRLEPRLVGVLDVSGEFAFVTQATYRFLSNPRVTAAALRRGMGRDTARRCRDHDVVLLSHDTTSLNFTGLRRGQRNRRLLLPSQRLLRVRIGW